MNLLSKAATLLLTACLSSRHAAHAAMIGDEVCITGYIMDKFCIDLGHFLDDSSNSTLENPEHHSFHCLLDVPRCRESGYLVLTDKNEETGMHCLGYRLNDTDAVLEAGRAAGRSGGSCTDCTGDESKPEHGFKATVKGTVRELGDGSDGVSGTPVLENVQFFEDSVVCETTVVDPVCMAPRMADPTPAVTPVTEPVSEAVGSTLSCPDTLDMSTEIDSSATLYYAMVPSNPTGSGNGILCGRLEVVNDGWIGLGFSENGVMQGSQAIIGLPGGDVEKYDLSGYNPTVLSDDKQTLRDASCSQEDGKMMMKFTKLLVEDGEVPIVEEGENIFLHARGNSDTLSYHSSKLSFKVDFSTPAAPSVDIKVGDKVCITNYIVDKYCIDLGHFLDDSSNSPLENPEQHSFHCLLDVPVCRESGYLVLTDKNEETDMHCLGYRLNDTDAVLEAGRAAGRSGGSCTDCTGDESKPERGFKATVKGTVMKLGDGTDGVSGTPVLGDIEVLEDSVVCETTVVDPVCMAPPDTDTVTVVPPVTETGIPAKDCTKEFCENQLSSEYLLRYQINVPTDTTVEVCNDCTISMELIYNGEAWVGIAFSEDQSMAGSEGVIGSPDDEPQKYNLGAQAAGVEKMPQSQQTLSDATCVSKDGQTIMKFTKIMKESGEIEITTGDNIFLWAYGSSNAIGYHAAKSPFELNLSSGTSEELSIPYRSAWLAHGIVAFLAWGVCVPFAVQSALLRNLLPKGPIWFNLHRAFNTTAYALFIVIFAIAVAYTNKAGGTHFDGPHQKMGLAMFILAFAQVFGGVFRPHVPAPDSGEEKTPVRKGWEVGHRVLGVSLLACGFWQMSEGIKLYAAKYSVSESDEDKLNIAYWVWIGVMSAIIVIGGGYFKYRKATSSNASDDAPPAAADVDDKAEVDDKESP